MDDWDDEKLAEVVSKKHGQSNSKITTTEIVSLLICHIVSRYIVSYHIVSYHLDISYHIVS